MARKFKMVIIFEDKESDGSEDLEKVKEIYKDLLNDWEYAITSSIESIEEIQPQS